MDKKEKTGVLNVRDLVNVGLFSVLIFIATFLSGMIGFNTVSRQLVARLSSLRDNRPDKPIQKCSKSPEPCGFPGFFYSRNADFVSLILFGFERF